MSTDQAAAVLAWDQLHARLRDLEETGFRVPCLDLADLFVSDDRNDRAAAIPWCLGCPALNACHTYAETAREPVYVWGGIDRAPRFRGSTLTKENN